MNLINTWDLSRKKEQQNAGPLPEELGFILGKPGEYLWIFMNTQLPLGAACPTPCSSQHPVVLFPWDWCTQGPTLAMEWVIPLQETASAEGESPTPRVIVGLKAPKETKHSHNHLPTSLLHFITRKMC